MLWGLPICKYMGTRKGDPVAVERIYVLHDGDMTNLRSDQDLAPNPQD